MTGQLLLRGMIIGIIAGIFAFGFARVFGEPMVDLAIAYEEKTSPPSTEPAEPELVSRATQAGIGLFTGIVTYSAAVGGLFALAFAFGYGRIGKLSPRGTAAVIALAAYVAIIAVPALKYPGNPPAVGSDETIVMRTELFFVLILASVIGMVLTFMLAANLTARLGTWNGIIASAVAYAVFMIIVLALLPTINEVPEDFSAKVLWSFRATSLGIQAIVWTILGLGFGWVAERTLIKQGSYRPVAAR
jgi:hypothetical protein